MCGANIIAVLCIVSEAQVAALTLLGYHENNSTGPAQSSDIPSLESYFRINSQEIEDSVHKFLAKLRLDSLEPSHEDQLLSAQTEVMWMQAKQEALNRRLRSGQFTFDFLYEYALKSSEDTKSVLSSTSVAMEPFRDGLQRSVANFLVGSFLNSVTDGANLYDTYLGGHHKSISADISSEIKGMASAYNGLVSLSKFAYLNAATLQRTNQHILSLL